MVEITNLVEHKLASMQRAERWAYHYGHLARERQFSYELDVTAQLLWKAMLQGKVILFQIRAPGVKGSDGLVRGGNGFVYYASKVRQ